ncbi:alpha/beta fold hydrolase [Haloplasma contractile]|uniref:Antibiotic-resistance protein alpha-beta superfamily hydrolase n=1 Tax=Haloplasma contractile SSD-17B TaxID=1033810 RepID=U2FKT7_9MOLU|nr:alpha/beta hydrolase [Haloplasma contractile]ERJ13400.1 Antibiotic-resistance protein alpha-beta superfamily hydrolase [Haloplasma contractile SSD-17B]
MEHSFTLKVHLKHECPIHYWITDNKSNKWIVFLHGAGLDHRMFAKQFHGIPTDYNLFLIDLRGHGKSRPIGINFKIDMVISDLIEILDLEEIKTAVFVGHSMGGHLAQEVRFRYPSRVTKLVQIDGMSITRKRTRGDKINSLISGLTLKVYSWENLISQNKRLASVKKQVQDYIEEAYRVIGKQDFVKIFNEQLKTFHHERRYLIKIPILLLAGEHDKTFNIKQEAYYWLNNEKNCYFHIIPNAAHNSNQDNPARVNTLLLDFLKNDL